MKKLATLLVLSSLSIAAPVLACPHEDGEAPATKTAEKTKDGKEAPAKDAPKQEAPKTTTAKAADKSKAQPKKDAAKDTKAAPKPTKVSQK